MFDKLITKVVGKLHKFNKFYTREQTTQKGTVATPENQVKYLYQQMQVDNDRRTVILDMRRMDKEDSRTKRIHTKMSRAATKGGLILFWKGKTNKKVINFWQTFVKNCNLAEPSKLESDFRALLVEGTLFMQWVLDQKQEIIVDALRMPSETIIPLVNESGRFIDVGKAYAQLDIYLTREIATFPLWQLSCSRLDPENFDDSGSLGRPYLDASRKTWKQLIMEEDDLVMRRRTRAPQRLSHVLEDIGEEDFEAYKLENEEAKKEIITDFYQRKKGGVTAIAGDANMDQIGDVKHLLETFFSASPIPMGELGYAGNLNRDVLEDLRRGYYEELDAMQDSVAAVYQSGFHLFLLLNYINPQDYNFVVQFKERRTATDNQRADLALKRQALNISRRTVLESAGIDPDLEEIRIAEEKKKYDPYPITTQPINPDVNITPNNAPKNESSTSITTR